MIFGRRKAAVWLAAAAIAAAVPAASTVHAVAGATVRSSTVVPVQPALGGTVRLGFDVSNDSGRPWSSADTVRLRWQNADGQPVAEESRTIGQDVAPGAGLRLTVVTLAPVQVGDFKLIAELVSGATAFPLGNPLSFRLDGFLFKGHGNGHGLGMSQWGARGRDSDGQTYRDILAAYYQGSTIETRDTARPVRISLTHGALDLSRPWARLFGPFPAVSGPVSVDGSGLKAGPGEVLGFGAGAAGQPVIFVQGADGRRSPAAPFGQTLVVRAAGPAGIRTNLLETLDGDFRSGSEQRRYAGELAIVPEGGARIRPVNVLPLEEYLKGVVPAEMPPFWGKEALKAQAVAARTYAMRKLQQGSRRSFDLEGNEFDQAYSGLSQQRDASTEAVEATRGQVLISGGALIEALYMASGGGHTEDSEYGFIRWDHGLRPAAVLPYLRGIADPLDRAPGWEVGPFSAGAAAVVLQDQDEGVGDRLVGIDVLQRGPSNRILGARLRGSSRTVEVSGPYLRFLFGLPDTLVEIVGSG